MIYKTILWYHNITLYLLAAGHMNINFTPLQNISLWGKLVNSHYSTIIWSFLKTRATVLEMSASSCQLLASSNMALARFMALTMPFISIKRENCQAILINDQACNIATELKSLGGINGHLSRFHFANFYHSAITLIQPSVFDRLLAITKSWFRQDPIYFTVIIMMLPFHCQQWDMGNIHPTV